MGSCKSTLEESMEIDFRIKLCERLEPLKEQKHLTKRIFKRISENMHYEIFKYLNPYSLLGVRSTSLGGYQLISNTLLRSRIQNYLHLLNCKLLVVEDTEHVFDLEKYRRKIKIYFEQGAGIFNLEGSEIGINGFMNVLAIIKMMSLCIKEINFGKMSVESFGRKEFKEHLKLFPQLNRLNSLKQILPMKNIRILALSKYFKYIPNLQILNLSGNELLNSGLRILAKHFKYIPNLQILNLGFNWFGDEGVLVEYFPDILRLKTVNLGIYIFSLLLFREEFHREYKNFLRTFTFNSNTRTSFKLYIYIGLTGVTAIGDNLQFVTKLQILNLESTTIGEHGVKCLAHNFIFIPNLLKLNLGGNLLADAGIKYLMEYIHQISKLKKLILWENNIMNVGKMAVTESLVSLSNLIYLNIEKYRIGITPIEKLIKVVLISDLAQIQALCKIINL